MPDDQATNRTIDHSDAPRGDSQSSVEIERNTRGVNWKVKVYDTNPDTALAKATFLDELLRLRYLATPPPMTKAEDKAPPAAPPAAKRVPRRRA